MSRPLNYSSVVANKYKWGLGNLGSYGTGPLGRGLGVDNTDIALSPTFNVYSLTEWGDQSQIDLGSKLTLQFPYGVAIQDNLTTNSAVLASQVPGYTTLGFPYAVGGTGGIVKKGSGTSLLSGIDTKTLMYIAGGLAVVLLLGRKRK